MALVGRATSLFRRLVRGDRNHIAVPRSRRQPSSLHCSAEILEERALLSAVALELVQEVLGGQLNGNAGTPTVVNEQLSNAVQQLAAGLNSLANSSQSSAAATQLGGSLLESVTAKLSPAPQAGLTQTLENLQQAVAGGIGAAAGQINSNEPLAQVQQLLLDFQSQPSPLSETAANAISARLDFVSDVIDRSGSETNNPVSGGGLASLISTRIGNALESLSDVPSLQSELDAVADRIETAFEPAIDSALPSEALDSVSALLDDLGDSLADWPQPREILQMELDKLFGQHDELDEILAAIS